MRKNMTTRITIKHLRDQIERHNRMFMTKGFPFFISIGGAYGMQAAQLSLITEGGEIKSSVLRLFGYGSSKEVIREMKWFDFQGMADFYLAKQTKKRLTKGQAKRLLIINGFDFNQDGQELHSDRKEIVADLAKKVGYRKPRNNAANLSYASYAFNYFNKVRPD